MKITLEIPDDVVEKVVCGIMANFPEASAGSSLQCTGWAYKDTEFAFHDNEEGKKYELDKAKLLAAFPLMFTDKWPKGCTPMPQATTWEQWEEWLCQADATDFDAFVQLACLGEVIYG